MTDNANPTVYSGTVYQNSIVPAHVLEGILMGVKQPTSLLRQFWEFQDLDIRVADIKSFDFQNVLDMIDLAVYMELFQKEEKDWSGVRFQETERVMLKTEKGDKLVDVVTLDMPIDQLQQALKAKMYQKMCSAREGFAFRQLTESHTSQELKGYPQEQNPLQPTPQGDKKKMRLI